jgi:HAD superfamily hydrolase (TIGR01450 family)
LSDRPALAPLLARYDHVLLDLDGCVWVGDEAVPGAADAVSALRAAGKSVAFVTNDGRHAGEDYVRKLWGLGFRAAVDEVVTVGGAMQHVLAEADQWRTAYVVGAPVIHRHVADAGLRIVNGRDVPQPDVVVVAAYDAFDYADLRGAIQAVLGGAALVCAGRDATFPMADGPWPGTGAVVAAVEAATGAEAFNVGKPAAQPFLTALDRLRADRADPRALVVGDRLDADLAGAHAAGLDAAIVLSGATGEREARAAEDPAPVAIAATLAELVLRR